MARILVTGGNGQLGTALGAVLKGHQVLLTDTDTMDITNPEQIAATFASFRPQVLIHCAAMTDVDGCQRNPAMAKLINATGTKNLARACIKHGVAMAYISTDYVFDGKATRPYKPDDKPNPISVYGRTKLAGEVATATVLVYWIIRTQWVYGEGHNFVRTMVGLADSHDVLSVVGDQWGRPTWAHDLALAIRDAIEKNVPVGIYHVTGSGRKMSWAQFTRKIFRITGKKTNVTTTTTKKYYAGKAKGSFAPRPLYSVLDLTKARKAGLYLADGEQSLRQYLP